MIETDNQYQVSKQQAARLERMLSDLPREAASRPHIHPKLQEAERHAVEDELGRINAEIAEYEALKAGTRTVIYARALEELPYVFPRAREISRTSAADIARRVGLSEDEYLTYERAEFADAPFHLVIEVAGALGLTVRGSIALAAPVDAAWLEEQKRALRSPFERLSTADSVIHD